MPYPTPTPGMEIMLFYQASQLFSECMSTFMKQCIRTYFKSGAQAKLATIQETYFSMNQMAKETSSNSWDVSFVFFLWSSDALLRPSATGTTEMAARVDEDAVHVTDATNHESHADNEHVPAPVPAKPVPDVIAKGYQPKIFALGNQLRGNVFASQYTNRIVTVEIGTNQVYVLHPSHLFAFDGIRSVRNRWAHGHPVSIATYLNVIETMYWLVRSLPKQFVTQTHHNQFNYVLVNMREIAEVAKEREKINQEKERLTQAHAQAQADKAALQAEIHTAQRRIVELSETLATVQSVQQQAMTRHDDQQAEQQMLVQALLRHLTNTTYHTNTTIDTLQDQVQRMQLADRDDLLLATIVQLQQVVVEQRQTIATLQHNLVVLDQGLHHVVRTKPIDPATVPVFDDDDPPPPPPPPPPLPTASTRWQGIWMLVLTAVTMALVWAWSTGMVATWWAMWAG